MARTKERKKIIHEPSTHELFMCLAGMVKWSAILIEHGIDKEYKPFLKQLVEVNYFEDKVGKITIKNVATHCNISSQKATKWIHEIYNDILVLNYDRPELFCETKTAVVFYFRHYDNSATVHLGVNILPREFEHFTFYFIKGKLGTSSFWVSRVEHEVDEGRVIPSVSLEGGILNKYREMAVEEALFKGWIGFMDTWQKHSFEIDELLIKHLRH